MDHELRQRLRKAHAEADAQAAIALARQLERAGALPDAASAWDVAFGLAPNDGDLVAARRTVLDELSVREHDLEFRYVPAGPFQMGSHESAGGDPDERPVHTVELGAFWLTEVPLSWGDYTRLLELPAPPAWPEGDDTSYFSINAHKIRMQYCGYRYGDEPTPETASLGPRPLTAIGWKEAVVMCERLAASGGPVYRLPSEPEWEKAARGGRVGARFPWGDAPADEGNCDCARFREVSILPSHTFAPNDYGLYAMAGGVCEWTADRYDALAYLERSGTPVPESPQPPPSWWTRIRKRLGRAPAPQEDPPVQYAARGGSWADDPRACTVSFRHALSSRDGQNSPIAGLRLARVEPSE